MGELSRQFGRRLTFSTIGIGKDEKFEVLKKMAEVASDYAGSIAANAPLTVAAMKFISTQVLADAGDRDLDRCQQMVADCFASEDFKEGRRAFMEKRKPQFQGR